MIVSDLLRVSLNLVRKGHLADMNTLVAADFGSDADTLAAASGIANKDVIFPGDIITVPCA